MLNELFGAYPLAPDCHDEMLDATRQPRAHWRAFLERLAAEGPEIMRERSEAVQRQVRENGVTYNVYADPKGMQRPWELNVLPLILPASEWNNVEAAVIQRATLLNRVLCDVYGEQSLVADGLLPPALIHANSGFLRPCHGIQACAGIGLHFYAVDLARAPDGRWWVAGDRTQAPSGAGYALENRSVIARIFPELLRELKVQHLGAFFDTMRDSLSHWGRQYAPTGETPLIVLLTPGPYNETYYEQAYLARHLGLPLVEGGDLTVRGGCVWLKTLSGMQRVHVIVRRLDDDYCDPLELRADSALGVSGLTDAVRRGNVLVANALGSNLLESGALLGYLPALCERLIGEPLKMPSVATWWCGEAAALEHVIGHLEQFVIKPCFSQGRQFPVCGRDLTAAGRAALIEQIRAAPNRHMAQESVRPSCAPVWKTSAPGGFYAGAIGLRVYACATPEGYVVMPGGLTRVGRGPGVRAITMQEGGASMDTWVQTGMHAHAHKLPIGDAQARQMVRHDAHLSSRMAENLFWLGRNAERCDNIARLMRVALNFLVNVRPAYRGAEWPAVQNLCGWFHLLPARGRESVPYGDVQIETALLAAVQSPDVPGLAQQRQQLYRVASRLRERLSLDNWRALNWMMQRTAAGERKLKASDALSTLDDAAASSMTMTGFAMDGMTRDLGWRFLSLGRRIERLQFQCAVVLHALAMEPGGSLDWLLELSDSIVTYRARYQAQPEWPLVLDLIVPDQSNPRSLAFQIDGILHGLDKMAASYGECADPGMAALKSELIAFADPQTLDPTNPALPHLVRSIHDASEALSEQTGVRFFSYSGHLSQWGRRA